MGDGFSSLFLFFFLSFSLSSSWRLELDAVVDAICAFCYYCYPNHFGVNRFSRGTHSFVYRWFVRSFLWFWLYSDFNLRSFNVACTFAFFLIRGWSRLNVHNQISFDCIQPLWRRWKILCRCYYNVFPFVFSFFSLWVCYDGGAGFSVTVYHHCRLRLAIHFPFYQFCSRTLLHIPFYQTHDDIRWLSCNRLHTHIFITDRKKRRDFLLLTA